MYERRRARIDRSEGRNLKYLRIRAGILTSMTNLTLYIADHFVLTINATERPSFSLRGAYRNGLYRIVSLYDKSFPYFRGQKFLQDTRDWILVCPRLNRASN